MTNTTKNNTTNNNDKTKEVVEILHKNFSKKTKAELVEMLIELTGITAQLQQEVHALKSNKVSAKAEKPSKKAEPKKEYGDTNSVEFVKLGKTGIEYNYADGGYVRHKGFRMYINSVLKNSGAKWNKDAKEWRFDSTKARDTFVKSNGGKLVFTTKQVDEYFAGLPQK